MEFTKKTTEDGRTLYCPVRDNQNDINNLEQVEVIFKENSLGVTVEYGGKLYGDYINVEADKLEADEVVRIVNVLLKNTVDLIVQHNR